MKTELVPVSRKVLILENIFLVVTLVFYSAFLLLSILDRELLLGSLVIDPRILGNLGLSCQMVYVGFTRKRSTKPKPGKIAWRICLIMSIFLILLEVSSISSDIKDTIAEKELTLSDGKKILMIESYYGSTQSEICRDITVYQKGFLSGTRLGRIDEFCFSNNCLLQNKYSYNYDAQSKILTIHCEHGRTDKRISVFDDTGIFSTEFQVK